MKLSSLLAAFIQPIPYFYLLMDLLKARCGTAFMILDDPKPKQTANS